MNYKPLDIRLEGFKSFKFEARFTFGEDVGFYMLTGDNQVDPRLSPNATGKSTIWDGLCWCFFGKTVRGLKAGEVVNWDDTEIALVTHTFSIDDIKYELMRTQNPNALTLKVDDGEPETVTQEKIHEVLGHNCASFLSVVLMGQFNRFFFDLGATDKLAIFSEALNLGTWLDASKRAGELAKEKQKAFEEVGGQIAFSGGALETFKEQRDSLKVEAIEWENSRDERLGALQDSLDAQVERSQEAVARVEELEAATKAEAEASKLLVKQTQACTTARGEITKKLEHYAQMKDRCNSELAALEKKKETIRNLKGTCPTCCQPLKKEAVKLACSGIDFEQDFITTEYEHVKPHRAELKSKLIGVEKAFQELEAAQYQSEIRRERLELDLRRAHADLAQANAAADAATSQIKREKKGANPHEAGIEKVRALIMATKTKLEDLEEIREKLVKEVAQYQELQDIFKQVRLWLIKDALLEFEVEVNNSLIQLGLEGWTVTFDVERENTSGGVTRGFSVFIQAPTSPSSVPWEAWSGGETQRLRIAGATGLARLISRRRGVFSEIEVWDEPTAHMNEGGIIDLLSFLENRAREEEKKIWLVDHHSLSYGGFDGIVTVVKTVRGSKITQFNRRSVREPSV